MSTDLVPAGNRSPARTTCTDLQPAHTQTSRDHLLVRCIALGLTGLVAILVTILALTEAGR